MSWELRGTHPHDHLDPNVYLLPEDETTWFTLQIFHGGRFVNYPGRAYVNGKNNFIDFIDAAVLSVYEIGQMIRSLGIPDEEVLFYHFKIPGMDLEAGLRPLVTDDDVNQLTHYAETVKIIELYVEHGSSNLQQVAIEDSGPPVTQEAASQEGIPIIDNTTQNNQQINISLHKVFRAKMKTLKKLEGDFTEQYAVLRDYCEELRRSNPGSTIKLEVEREFNPTSTTRQFRRLYVCLAPLKEGFKSCGRDILGLDGCFMKGPFPGQILTAVGVDANNGIYPVAYALVEAETFNSWSWFLEILGDDLGITSNSNFTFITDRQKGLLPAIQKLFPSATHRFCLRHIHENMKIKWRGNQFKDLLWKAASATTIPQFLKAMEVIKKQDPALHTWLSKIPAKSWAKSHFSGRPKCDVLLNNWCEVFNRQLIGARDKPIITCLEYIKDYIMKRIVAVHHKIAKTEGRLTPSVTKQFNAIKTEASQYTVVMAGGNKYQVSGPWLDQCVVDMNAKACSCRKWELTGIPCKHAVAVIWNMAVNGMDVGNPEQWVSEIYTLAKWKEVYMHTIEPINGIEMWILSDCPTTLRPPKHKVQIGRPKKKRRKSQEEIMSTVAKDGKLTRKGHVKHCGRCKKPGHNARTCKGETGQQAA